MCGLLDDVIPIIGTVVGSLVGGPLGGIAGGALLGGGLSAAEGKGFGAGALAGGLGGLSGGFGAGGSLSSALGLGEQGATNAAFDTGLAANTPGTLGGLESATGGAALFGPMSGTGTAIGGAAGALGGGGLGIAGGDALSGISSGALSSPFFGALGGGTGGTGLGIGTTPGSTGALYNPSLAGGPASAQPSTLQQAFNGNTPTATLANTPTGPGGEIAGMPNLMGSNAAQGAATPGVADLSTAGGAQQTASLEGAQAGAAAQGGTNVGAAGALNPDMTTGSGAPYGFGTQTAQAEAMPGTANLNTLYGPNSTAMGSPAGQGIGATGAPFNNVQAGALGEATGGKVDLSELSQLFGGAGGQQSMGMNPFMQLAKAGLGAYQDYQKQKAFGNYMNQINDLYSPNSPYAQQMAQTLARQDAAAGRNSQYGNRAVQLAAALTQGREHALTSAPYSQAAFATPGANMLNNLLYFPGAMQGLGQLGSAGLNSLSSLFG